MESNQARRRPRSHGCLRRGPVAATGLLSVLSLAACSGTPSTSPTTSVSHPGTPTTQAGAATTVTIAPDASTPGDIPDTTAYIPYTNTGGGYTFVHPEGWALSAQGTSAAFTDKYNGVSASATAANGSPDVTSAQATDIPALKVSEPAFALVSVAEATLPAGRGVLIVYRRNSPPDPVTGRSVRQEVNRYEIFSGARVVTFALFGAVGADNGDPYKRMSQSLQLS